MTHFIKPTSRIEEIATAINDYRDGIGQLSHIIANIEGFAANREQKAYRAGCADTENYIQEAQRRDPYP